MDETTTNTQVLENHHSKTQFKSLTFDLCLKTVRVYSEDRPVQTNDTPVYRHRVRARYTGTEIQ